MMKKKKARRSRGKGAEAEGLPEKFSDLSWIGSAPDTKKGLKAGRTGAVKAKSITMSACFGMRRLTGYKRRECTEVTVLPLIWTKKQ